MRDMQMAYDAGERLGRVLGGVHGRGMGGSFVDRQRWRWTREDEGRHGGVVAMMMMMMMMMMWCSSR